MKNKAIDVICKLTKPRKEFYTIPSEQTINKLRKKCKK